MKETSFRELEDAALAGDPDSEYRVGSMYLTGRYYQGEFIPKLKERAESLIKSAASKGHEQAREYVQNKEREEKKRAGQERMNQLERGAAAMLTLVFGLIFGVFVLLGALGLLWFGIRQLF